MKAYINTNDILAVMTAVSKDKTRPILTGVHIEVENNRVTLIATDSYRMIVTEDKSPDNEDGEITVDLSSIKFKKNQKVYVESDGEKTTLTMLAGNMKYEPQTIQGTYPNWKQLIPSDDSYAEPTTYIGVNPDYVRDMGKAFRAWSNCTVATVWFEFEGTLKPMSMNKRDGERSFFGLIMPTRMSDGDLHLVQPSVSTGSKDELQRKIRELEAEIVQKDKDIEMMGELVKNEHEAAEKLAKQLKDAKDVKQHIKDHVKVVDATPTEDKELDEANERISSIETKLEAIVKAFESKSAPSHEQTDINPKIDALIAEYSGIKIAGETSCAVYFEPTIKKDSPEMVAVKEAGGRWGNHRKFGKCWYMPR